MIDPKEYWNQRYTSGGNSGYGSYGEQLEKKLKWLSGLDIKSITEIGCGDFNFGSHLMEKYPNVRYQGYDISDVIITQNNKNYPQYYFGDIKEAKPQADLVLCVDVLFHILDDMEYEKTLNELESLWTDYLAITAYESEQRTAEHLNVRKFDYRRFGEPLIRKVVEEDGQLYFYLFKK